ncbi:MAG: MlaE family ABC transporter permease [Bacteroidota bacterium]
MDAAVLRISDRIKGKVYNIQRYFFFCADTVLAFPSAFRYRRDTLEQMYVNGVQAVTITAMGGLFIGLIMAIETGHRFEAFGAKLLVGRTVALAVVRTLGPVITGLMLAARNGSKNAAELGSMQVSEQIDALKAFGTDPIAKLVVPRVISSLIMFLPLTLLADAIALIAGMWVSDVWLHVDPVFYWSSAINGLRMQDLIVGFTKPFTYAFVISTISCYYGLTTTGGTTGVGRATINAVVMSSIVVLFVDFIFTKVVWELLK